MPIFPIVSPRAKSYRRSGNFRAKNILPPDGSAMQRVCMYFIFVHLIFAVAKNFLMEFCNHQLNNASNIQIVKLHRHAEFIASFLCSSHHATEQLERSLGTRLQISRPNVFCGTADCRPTDSRTRTENILQHTACATVLKQDGHATAHLSELCRR